MAQDQYDARQIEVTVDGGVVAQLDTVGYDQSRGHELDRSLQAEGEDDVWVEGDGEYSGTVSVKAVSDSVPTLEGLFQENTQFTIAISYPDASPRSSTEFTSCMFTDFGPADDWDNESMPMFEGSFTAADVSHS